MALNDMALYSFDSRILGRSSGHTAVGYAAYCAAEKLYDDYYGQTRNYAKAEQGERIYAKGIMAPAHAPDWVHDRTELWNHVEKAEKRKDSQLCREIIITLPRELTHEQNHKLIKRYVQEQYVNRGMIADVSLHNFEGKNPNPHVHILLTTRRIEKDGFAAKKEDDWRPKITKDPKTKRAIIDPEYIKAERQIWEGYYNHALEQAGRDERVDCRSLKDRGIDKIPAPKLGKAHKMEQRPEWQGKTRAGDDWRAVKDMNDRKRQLQKLEQERAKVEKEIAIEKRLAVLEVAQQYRESNVERTPEKSQTNRAHRTAKNVAQTLHEKPPSSPQKEPANSGQELTQDERELLRQWQEYRDRERNNQTNKNKKERGWEPER